jgi:hypothetical protein
MMVHISAGENDADKGYLGLEGVKNRVKSKGRGGV